MENNSATSNMCKNGYCRFHQKLKNQHFFRKHFLTPALLRANFFFEKIYFCFFFAFSEFSLLCYMLIQITPLCQVVILWIQAKFLVVIVSTYCIKYLQVNVWHQQFMNSSTVDDFQYFFLLTIKIYIYQMSF